MRINIRTCRFDFSIKAMYGSQRTAEAVIIFLMLSSRDCKLIIALSRNNKPCFYRDARLIYLITRENKWLISSDKIIYHKTTAS